jgi:acetyltransferase-like isoleucine patch superfamily enzyme
MQKILNFIFLRYLNFKYSKIKFKGKIYIDYQSSIIIYNNELTFGENVVVRSRKKGYHAAMPFASTILIDVADAKVRIGDNSRLNGVYIHAQKEISIGKNCVIASGVNIIDSNGHVLNSLDRTKGRDLPKEIIIEDNVWIGLNCVILKGTRIGKNSVISAGSIVKGIFPENSIISGNPAEVVDIIRNTN